MIIFLIIFIIIWLLVSVVWWNLCVLLYIPFFYVLLLHVNKSGRKRFYKSIVFMHHRACWIRNNIFQHMQHLYSDLARKLRNKARFVFEWIKRVLIWPLNLICYSVCWSISKWSTCTFEPVYSLCYEKLLMFPWVFEIILVIY